MGLFERFGRNNAKKETYDAIPVSQKYGLDKEKPKVREAHEEGMKEAEFNSALFQLHMKLASRLAMSLARQNVENQESAMKELKTDIDQRMNALKAAPSEASIESLQSWALSRSDEKHHGVIAQAFADLRESLVEQGVLLGE